MDGYYGFMLVATLLVLMMTTPALALFYGGMSRSKSVLNMMMMSYVAMAVVGIAYVLWGWSMSFGGREQLGGLFADPLASWGLKGVGTSGYVPVFFQLAFAVITAALVSGAVADRVKLSSWIVFLPLWATLSYFPLAHMVFSCTAESIICGRIGAQDYAGGTAVHINAGVAGMVLALIVGRRIGFGSEPMRPHNLTLTMLGAGLLWMGWYGFNVGSIVFTADWGTEAGLAANTARFVSETGRTFATTTVAAMAALLGWLVVERVLHGRATTLGAASGIVAGLVAITPATGAVDLTGALVIGAVAGGLCAWAVGLKFRLGLDDSLDVVGVHLVGGLVGTVLIGLFSVRTGAGGVDGLLHGGGFGSLVAQVEGAGFAIAWSAVATTIVGLAIRHTIGWRVDAEDEIAGIDHAEHGETAYDLHPAGPGMAARALDPRPRTRP